MRFLRLILNFVRILNPFLLTAPRGGNKEWEIYLKIRHQLIFLFLKLALKQAFIDGYFTTDISAKIKGNSRARKPRREYLTIDELEYFS